MRPKLLFIAAAVGITGGCGGARVISRTPAGGVLVLEGSRSWSRDIAHRRMVDHCRGPYTIVREGDDAIGAVTEFRVHYVCGARPGLPTSQYGPPTIPLEGIPNANSISID
jgi:hypothetical protein